MPPRRPQVVGLVRVLSPSPAEAIATPSALRAAAVVRLLVLCVTCLASGRGALGLDHVTFRRDGRQSRLSGRLLVTAQDGGLLVLARDGVLWAIPPEQQVQHTADDAPFEPFSPEQLAQRMLAALPSGFDVHRTARYLICHDTSRAYAQWCGALFERLYLAFTNYWSRKGFELAEPEFPLVAIVFAEQGAFVEFSQEEVGGAAAAIIGYFSLRTNRMTMYDLTGIEALSRFRKYRTSAAQINRVLAQPEALRQVSTIVHEATHQIAFNCGLHTRYSDCPMWFSEGIAMYFETPDLRSSRGWRGIGAVNRPRLAQFRRYLRTRPPDSLASLLRDDQRFRDTKQGLNAYAEAWALTYYLLRQRPEQYVAYLKILSAKKPLIEDGPPRRLEEFARVFGELKELDAEFVRYMLQVR